MTDLTREFPHFDPATLPAIPAGFWPTHWHNDSQPTWHESPNTPERGSLMLAIDYADPSQREWAGEPRFTLQIYDANDCSPFHLFSTDAWHAIETMVRFVRYVRKFGLGFHPDTRGSDYAYAGGALCFSPEEAKDYDEAIDAAFDVLGDLYEFAITFWRALGLIEHV